MYTKPEAEDIGNIKEKKNNIQFMQVDRVCEHIC